MLLIPALAELIGLPLHKSGVSLINVHGTSFERYVKLFSRSEMWTRELNLPTLDIPISIITDIDVKPYIYYEKEGFITTFSIKDIAHLQSISKLLGINFEDLNDECIGKEYSTLKKLAKDFNFEVNPTDESALIAALKNDISEEYIQRSINEKRTVLENKYNVYNCNLKLTTAPEWTLEYSLSLSCLRQILYRAIHSLRYKDAFKDKRLVEYQQFVKKFSEKSDSNEEIAYEIFKPLNKKLVSKAEVAQEVSVQLLNLLEVNKGNEEVLDQMKQTLLQDEYLKYLIQAIQQVSNENASNRTVGESLIEEGALS